MYQIYISIFHKSFRQPRCIVIACFCIYFTVASVHAQELFAFTEPASNMPAKSGAIRITNTFMDELSSEKTNTHIIPELMYGFNKNFMIHASAFISNRNNGFITEGGALYARYRFLSNDDLHRHFRMALYGKYAFNNSDIHQDEIEISGHNSGFESGIIATQLLHKTALSATVSFEKAIDNNSNKFPDAQAASAINYSLSCGKLMLPKDYSSFKQTNMNAMIELLGQTLPQNGKSYFDIAPAIQFIFNSQARIDAGYRFQLLSSMNRTAPQGFLLRFEYLLFNPFENRN